MPLMNAIKYALLKSPIRILHLSKRNLKKKKSISTDFSPFLKDEGFSNFEKMQNSVNKLTPKGFEVIYIVPFLKWIKGNYAVLPLCWACLCYDTYYFFKSPEEYIAAMQKRIKEMSYKDKIFQTIGLTFFILALHLLPSRVVVATFRKENEFQTLLYGILGPLTKKYVSHGLKAMEPTPKQSIYILKGKKVLLFSDGFRHFNDFESVVA